MRIAPGAHPVFLGGWSRDWLRSPTYHLTAFYYREKVNQPSPRRSRVESPILLCLVPPVTPRRSLFLLFVLDTLILWPCLPLFLVLATCPALSMT